ncbi:MAG: hypothetical protein GC192_19720 [Bacteroidetes bacterium]|nr:hypothetical protein [Bacteroidota bacterium]
MKIIIVTVAILIVVGIIAYSSSKSKKDKAEAMVSQSGALKTLEESISYIASNFKNSEETLLIADSMNDDFGVNMTLIMDRLLKMGYAPDGFEQREGFRIYKYKKSPLLKPSSH